jgi:AraC-like DNA-binding protein
LSGPTGLARLHGRTATKAEQSGFQSQIVTARFGEIDVGVMRCTAHRRDNGDTNFGHNHPVSRLVIITQGRAEMTVSDRVLDLVPGTGLLVPGETGIVDRANSTVTRLYLDISTQSPRFAALLSGTPVAHWATRSAALDALVAFGQSVLAADDATMGRACRAEVQRLLEALVLTTIAAAPPLRDECAHPLSLRSLALGHIRQHFTDARLSPATLAQALGVSVRTLQRAFKDEPGAAERIARFRLDHALALLGDERFDSLSITDIAARAGFRSTTTMRRAVTAATGRCPAKHRQIR